MKTARPAFSRLPLLACLSFHSAPAAHAQSVPDNDEVLKLSPFNVSSEKDRGYGVSNTVGATRISAPIGDVPQSITVLNSKFMEDLAAVEVMDAGKYVSGVTKAGDPLGGQLTLRGWNIPGATFRDGLYDPLSIHGAILLDMSVVERMEFIKGPSGTLYGSHVGGGIINLVSKTPQPIAQATAKFTVGDYQFYRGELDINRPLDREGKWLARFIVAYQDAETLTGLVNNKLVVNPSLTFKPNGSLEVRLRYAYQHPRISAGSFPWFADKDWKISTFLPVDQPITDKDDDREDEIHQLDLDVLQAFTLGETRWDMRLKARFNDVFAFWRPYSWGEPAFRFVDQGGAVIGDITNFSFDDPRWANMLIGPRVFQERKNRSRTTNLNLDLTGSFSLGKTHHKVITYLSEAISEEYRTEYLWDYPTLDLNHRVYYPNPQAVATNFRLGPNTSTDAQGFAWGTQDNVNLLSDRLILVAGLRYDRSNSKNLNRLNNTPTSSLTSAWSTRYGLVAKPMKGVSLFLNHAETFLPLAGVNNFTGLPWKDQITLIKEAGAKLEIFNGRLTTTFSYFDMKQDNARVTTDVRVNPQTGGLETVMEQKGYVLTKGFELDFAASIGRGLSLMGGYGDLTSKSQAGVPLRAVPLGPNYRLWAKYDFAESRLRGLYSGLGFEHTPRRDINGTGAGYLPKYDCWDALLGYRWRNHTFQLNVTNVFDKVYPAIAVARQIIYPGDARKIRLTVGCTF